MPYVNVKITKDVVTRAQKHELVAEITAILVRVLHKKPEQTHIVIDEVESDNWGYCGMLTTDFRRLKSAATPEATSNVERPRSVRTRAPRVSRRRA